MNAEWLDDEVYGPYADEDWASNFPKSNGWVALGPNHDMFVLSMFHQLHCLDALRFGYVTAKARVLEFPGNGTGVEHHVNHCLTCMYRSCPSFLKFRFLITYLQIFER